jgi:pantetheine-phosphate adenylyltransferase
MAPVVVAGSFDPVTLGHVDIFERAVDLFGEVVVAVGMNSTKDYLFTPAERVALVEQACAHIKGVRVEPMDGLVVDFCRRVEARVILKGARDGSDFDNESRMAHMNRSMTGVETVVLPASPQWSYVSSTLIRQIARQGGNVSGYVPGGVAQTIQRKINGRTGDQDSRTD